MEWGDHLVARIYKVLLHIYKGFVLGHPQAKAALKYFATGGGQGPSLSL